MLHKFLSHKKIARFRMIQKTLSHDVPHTYYVHDMKSKGTVRITTVFQRMKHLKIHHSEYQNRVYITNQHVDKVITTNREIINLLILASNF